MACKARNWMIAWTPDDGKTWFPIEASKSYPYRELQKSAKRMTARAWRELRPGEKYIVKEAQS